MSHRIFLYIALICPILILAPIPTETHFPTTRIEFFDHFRNSHPNLSDNMIHSLVNDIFISRDVDKNNLITSTEHSLNNQDGGISPSTRVMKPLTSTLLANINPTLLPLMPGPIVLLQPLSSPSTPPSDNSSLSTHRDQSDTEIIDLDELDNINKNKTPLQTPSLLKPSTSSSPSISTLSNRIKALYEISNPTPPRNLQNIPATLSKDSRDPTCNHNSPTLSSHCAPTTSSSHLRDKNGLRQPPPDLGRLRNRHNSRCHKGEDDYFSLPHKTTPNHPVSTLPPPPDPIHHTHFSPPLHDHPEHSHSPLKLRARHIMLTPKENP